MLPDNPNLLEEYIWTKVDEIKNEVQDATKHPIKKKINIKQLVISLLVVALAVMLMIVL